MVREDHIQESKPVAGSRVSYHRHQVNHGSHNASAVKKDGVLAVGESPWQANVGHLSKSD